MFSILHHTFVLNADSLLAGFFREEVKNKVVPLKDGEVAGVLAPFVTSHAFGSFFHIEARCHCGSSKSFMKPCALFILAVVLSISLILNKPIDIKDFY